MSTPRRRHVTTACLPCRESKVKCDGASPTCSSCRTKGKECLYQAGDDKRKLSIRVAIELLSARIEQLCKFVHGQGLLPPPMPSHDRHSLMKSLDYLKLAHIFIDHSDPDEVIISAGSEQRVQGDSRVVESIALEESIEIRRANLSTSSHEESLEPRGSTENLAGLYTAIDSNLMPDVSHAVNLSPWPSAELAHESCSFEPLYLRDDHLGTFSHSNMPNNATHETCPQPSLPPPNKDISDSKNTEDLIDQLSERVGSLQIGPGGHVRYYGPTSNFNLVHMPDPDNLTVHRTVQNDGQDYLERLGLDKEIPADIEEHLTNLFFAWQNPVFQIVNHKMFEGARMKWQEKREDTPYYSEALQNAICSLGAAFEPRHHPTFITFPSSPSDFFANRSKALLEIELDSPCVATVQAMVVLSGHDIGCKRDARGWLYSGMAMRLAFDLALHVDMGPHVAKGSLTEEEAEVRRDVFWGTFNIDHMWGFYLGRPFRINMEDVTVSKPSCHPELVSGDTWSPYVSPVSVDTVHSLKDYPNLLLQQRALMAEIMAPLGYALYGSLKISPKKLQEMNVETVDRLFGWKTSLPSVLQVDVNDRETHYFPHVILLHMQYYQNIIHAHRPWMSRTYYQPIPPQGPGSDHARMMCMSSAHAIAKLLHLYEKLYTFRRMNIQGVGVTCSAALLLIFATVTNRAEQDTRVGLRTCFRALDEFGPAWESARRAKDFLVLLQRQWVRSTKARRGPPGSLDSTLRKRMRTLGHDDEAQSPYDHTPEFIDPELGLSLDWVLTSNVFQVGDNPESS